ncbi:hypothetical protein PS903_02476 [Pseudomonas fluorescens]|nr:hypothetical protein PS903_02476 [Pseudomonas fluorescens]
MIGHSRPFERVSGFRLRTLSGARVRNTAALFTEILRLSTDKNEGGEGLFGGPGTLRQGSIDSDEILIGMVKALFPRKPYCLVDDWTLFNVDVTEVELQKIHAAGQLPLIVFAHNVRFDSERRFDVGDWVRSTLATSFEEGFLFETRNTVYVLCGDGHEKATSLKTALSFF